MGRVECKCDETENFKYNKNIINYTQKEWISHFVFILNQRNGERCFSSLQIIYVSFHFFLQMSNNKLFVIRPSTNCSITYKHIFIVASFIDERVNALRRENVDELFRIWRFL